MFLFLICLHISSKSYPLKNRAKQRRLHQLQCCCFVTLICFCFVRRHLILMIYGFSFLSIPIALALFPSLRSALCFSTFMRSLFPSSHLSSWSEPLLLLELWDARLDTPYSYELISLINPADLSKSYISTSQCFLT